MRDDRRQFRVRVFIFSVRGIAFTKIDTVARLHAQNTAYFFVLGCNLRKLPLYPHERRNSYFLTWDWFSCFWKSDPRQFLRNFVLHFTSYLCWKGKKRFWLNTIHELTSFSFPYSFCIIIFVRVKKIIGPRFFAILFLSHSATNRFFLGIVTVINHEKKAVLLCFMSDFCLKILMYLRDFRSCAVFLN